MKAQNNGHQDTNYPQVSSRTTSYDTSSLPERSDNFFSQDFFDANLLNEDLLKDLDFDSLDLGYFEELFGGSVSGQMPPINAPALTFGEATDLRHVRGIGVATVENIKPYLVFPTKPMTSPNQ